MEWQKGFTLDIPEKPPRSRPEKETRYQKPETVTETESATESAEVATCNAKHLSIATLRNYLSMHSISTTTTTTWFSIPYPTVLGMGNGAGAGGRKSHSQAAPRVQKSFANSFNFP